MFSVESSGIKEQEALSNYVEQMVEFFRQFISFKNKKYYVAWDSDKISFFTFNPSVALHLLEPVAGGLERDLLYRHHFEMFRHQERDGIIDVLVPPQRYKENI